MNQNNESSPSLTPKLARLLRNARLAQVFEHIWLLVAPIFVLGLFYCALAWSGALMVAPIWLRITIIAIFGIALVFCLVRMARFGIPTHQAAIIRLDNDSALPHGTVQAAFDTQSIGEQNAETAALWQAHQSQALQKLETLSPKLPQSLLTKKDPYALRIAGILMAFAAFFISGGDWHLRLMSGFDFKNPPHIIETIRLDAWIDPPRYTNHAPIFLTQKALSGEPIHVPIGSILVIRAATKETVIFDIAGAIAQGIDKEKDKQNATEHRYIVKGDGSVKVHKNAQKLGTFNLISIPDLPPNVEFLTTERRPKSDGSDTIQSDVLVLHYKLSDDYGVASGEVKVEIISDQEPRKPRLIIPISDIKLSIPAMSGTAVEGETTLDLSDHPLAGSKVRLSLKVRDDIGQEATSNAIDVVLPQRPFADPIAKALVEQRRNLTVYPDDRAHVALSLVGLLTEPAAFHMPTALFTGLRMAQMRLKSAHTDAANIDIAEWLWQMALAQDEGNLSAAERALRAAQQSLSDAIERGAPEGEMKRLTENMRQAMKNYTREFAQKNKGKERGEQDPNAKMLSSQDLAKILEKIEELTKQGKIADAQRMLEKLNEMLKNMQTAQGSGGDDEEKQKSDLQKKSDGLNDLTRDEQRLRDHTYREGQDRQRGKENGEKPEKDKQGNSLQNRQKRLSDQLQQLQKDLKGNEGKALKDAENAMREAEKALGEGKNGAAVEKQGQALDALRRGAESLAQKLGELKKDDKQEGRSDNANTDPLGRPTIDSKPTRENGDNNAKLRTDGKGGGTIEERSRAVLEELRRRLGEVARPQTELDYIERLLRR